MSEQSTEDVIEMKIAEYSPTAAALADLRHRFSGVVYDVATVKGDKEARAARLELVRLDSALEAKRKELKAPSLERSRLIDFEAKQLATAIEDLKAPIDDQIKAEEQRKEAERERKVQVERDRVAAIVKRIDAIKAVLQRAVGLPAARIEVMLKEVVGTEIGDDFQELRPQAELAHMDVLDALRELLAKAIAAEEEAERQQAERKRDRQERDRIAAEQRAEADRLAREREQLQADQRAQQEQHARQRAEQHRLDEQAAEVRRQADAAAAAARENEARIAREVAAAERQRIDAEAAELRKKQDAAATKQRAKEAAKAEADRQQREEQAAELDRARNAAPALLAALVIAMPYVAEHGTTEDLAQCNAAIDLATKL